MSSFTSARQFFTASFLASLAIGLCLQILLVGCGGERGDRAERESDSVASGAALANSPGEERESETAGADPAEPEGRADPPAGGRHPSRSTRPMSPHEGAAAKKHQRRSPGTNPAGEPFEIDPSYGVSPRMESDLPSALGSSVDRESPMDELDHEAPDSLAEASPPAAAGEQPEDAPDSDPLTATIGDFSEEDSQLPRQADHAQAADPLVGKIVDVFFATDRLPMEELIPSPTRVFAPAAAVGMICCALFIGLLVTRRFQALWLLGCSLAVCMGITVLHVSIVRWQQVSRLAGDASTQFSSVRYESGTGYPLHVGTARVSFPATHKPGVIESPSLLRLEFVETPEKHVVLHSLKIEESSEEWFATISEQVRYAEQRESFIFLHGYNVRFADAIKRTAQLATDLKFSGPAICYSWPSRGRVSAYPADEASVSWSAPHFEQLLLDLRAKTECRTINIVAHSMGNRALLEAVERINLRMAGGQPTKIVGSVVMAAPDVDVQKFTSRYLKPLKNVTSRATLYFSSNDRPLQLSSGIHGGDRLGLTAAGLSALTGIEAIHIDAEDIFSLGHSYYGSDRAVIDDLRALLIEKKPAAERQFLRRIQDTGGGYWQIDRTLHAGSARVETR